MLEKALVIEYLELHAQSSTCEKRLKALREVLLPQLRDGEESPGDLPYLLARRIQERTTKDWLSPLYRLLKRTLGKVRADLRIAQIEARFECTEVEQLCVEQNKEYAADLSAQPAA